MALQRTEFIRRLKQARDDVGITQEELARRVGVTHKTSNRWEALENGHTPNTRRIEQIAEQLGVTRDYLLGETPDTQLREERLLALDEKVNEIHAMLRGLLAHFDITADTLVQPPAELLDVLNDTKTNARKRRRSG